MALLTVAQAAQGLAVNACRLREYHEMGYGAPLRLDSVQVWSFEKHHATTQFGYHQDGKLMSITQRAGDGSDFYTIETVPKGFLARRQGETVVAFGKYYSPDFRLDSSRGNSYRQLYRYSVSGYTIRDNDQGKFELTDSIRYTDWGHFWFRDPFPETPPDSCVAKADTCECFNPQSSPVGRTEFRNGLIRYSRHGFGSPDGANPPRYLDWNRYFWSERTTAVAPTDRLAASPRKTLGAARPDGRRFKRAMK